MKNTKNRAQFVLLCISTFLFFASFNMIIPELPSHLSNLGGEDYKGLIIALFTVTAGLSRPYSGKLADKIGRLPVMYIGAGVCIIASLLYPFVGTVFSFLLLRFFHGFSTGFKPTGSSAYVADIVPPHRRGEAMGYIGLAGSLGMAAGPAMGSYIAMLYGLDNMFYLSSFMAFCSIIILSGMRESLENKEAFRMDMLVIGRNEIYEPRVLAPSIVLLLTVFSFGTVLTIIPDFSDHLGIVNRGVFFTAFTLASLGVRVFAGKISDKHGRVKVLKYSTALLFFAMLAIAFADSLLTFIAAAVVFGLAVGMNSPTVFAWTIDLAHNRYRGRAMATMYIALEIGIGAGAVISAWVYHNDAAMFPWVFMLAALFSLLAFLYLQLRHRSMLKHVTE